MKKLFGLIAAALLVGTVIALLRFYLTTQQSAAPVVAGIAEATPARSSSSEFAPPPVAAVASLPALDASDAPLRDALTRVFGKSAVYLYLNPERIARRIVALVDSLPRQHTGGDAWPVKPVVSGFIATGDEQPTPLAAENFAKYAPYVKLVATLDADKFSAVYFSFYPLLQQAYAGSAQSHGQFNDRVLAAIDNLLAAPNVATPPMVVRKDALYEYADPSLENISVGQKLMLRMGAENAAVIKNKLRTLRPMLARYVPSSAAGV